MKYSQLPWDLIISIAPHAVHLLSTSKEGWGGELGWMRLGGLPSWENEMKAFFRSLYCSSLPAHGTQISDIIDPNLFCINHDSELNWIYLVNQFNYCTVEKLGTLSIFIADLSMLMSSWTNLHPNEFEVLGPDSSAGLQDSDRDSASPRNPPEDWGGCDVVENWVDFEVNCIVRPLGRSVPPALVGWGQVHRLDNRRGRLFGHLHRHLHYYLGC